jgi:peptidoglycan hydrolase CwlO-like protein
VKLSRALVQDLDEAVQEFKLLGEHEEESSQKITELEALCKRLREDTQKLKEEKTTLEVMILSRDADHGDGQRVWTQPHGRERQRRG